MLTSALRSGFRVTGLGLALVVGPVMAESEQDPWEGFNRSVFTFNENVDRYAIKPLAQGYRYVTPDLAEQGVSNFFDNIGDVGNLLNNLLQFKFEAAGRSFARLTFNPAFGLVGLVDVATPMGIDARDEDFGQTLGYWGVGSWASLVACRSLAPVPCAMAWPCRLIGQRIRLGMPTMYRPVTASMACAWRTPVAAC